MSRPGDIRSKTQKPHSAAGLATLSDRFHTAMAFEGNKPDSKDFSELDSPISPLRARGAASSNTSSSSSSSGSFSGKTPPNAAAAAKSDGAAATVGDRRSHSGELSGSSDGSPNSADRRYPRPTHRRSGSGPLIYSGGSGSGSGSTANSPATNVLPAGNIFPSGKIGKTGMMPRSTPRSDVLGSGTGNYGHGSIMRAGATGSTGLGKQGGDAPAVGDSAVRGSIASTDPEEVTKAGNEHYKKGQFADALRLYDRAIMMCPGKAACRSNRAAALTGLGRLGEAVKECEEAVRLDPMNGRAHQRLASLHLRLGQVENARRHHNLAGQQSDPKESQKLQMVQRHMGRCDDARKIRDWKSALREADAAIAAGADSSPLLIAVRAEALLRLLRLNEADSTLSNSCKLGLSSSSTMQTKFFGMLSDSYVHVVRAQVEMALGRFENAVVEAEKAREIDPKNAEVMVMLNNVRLVSRARARGNELFKSGNFADACMAYGEGLKYDPSNPVLHCNRAACFSKLEQVEKSVEDCNEALRIQPNYTKALLRRAASYAKLERWVESVRDYEVLRKELPSDTEVAEALFHAQVALKTSRGEEVSNMKFGGEVEEITGREQFQSAIALPGVSVVYFMDAMDQQCTKINPFVDLLCSRYPSLNFLKVNIKESQDVAKDESVVTVPTFKIYKNGARVKAMICPTQQVLEYSVRHYGI